jgi:hypothetical protein
MSDRLKRVGRWFAERLKDLFYDPTNTKLDSGRVLGWIAATTLIAAAGWNVHLGREIDLTATGFPGGLTAVLGALVVYMVHDRKNTPQG